MSSCLKIYSVALSTRFLNSSGLAKLRSFTCNKICVIFGPQNPRKMSVRSKLRRNCSEIWRKSKLSPSFSLSPSPLRLWFRHSDICNRRCEAANSDHNSPLGRSRESSVTTRTDKMKRKRALTDKPTENREAKLFRGTEIFCSVEGEPLLCLE